MRNKFSIEDTIPSSGFLSQEPCFFRVESRSRISGTLAGFLILIFISSSLIPAYAEDNLDITASSSVEVLPEPEATDTNNSSEEISVTDTIETAIELVPESTPESTPDPVQDITPEPIPELTPEPTPELTPEPDNSPVPSSLPEVLETPTPSPISEPTPTPIQSSLPTPTPTPYQQIEEVPEIDVEKLREEIRKEILDELSAETEEEQQMQESVIDLSDEVAENNFSESDCVKLSEAELYCLKSGVKNGSIKPSPSYVGAYVESDGSDNEIIFQKGGRTVKITDNLYDDVLPVYDESANIIVWQSLVNDRWQIMIYDFRDGAIRQLTDTNGNNLNPGIDGGIIVWQGWVGNNWEIFMAEKKIQDADWFISPITDNYWHDINPRLVGDYILWEAFKDNTWQIFSYSFGTKNIEQLSSGLGRNSNPRLAILWESEEGGVVKTLQYDITTQSVSAVTSKGRNEAQPMPELPNKEQEVPLPLTASSSSNFNQRDNNDEE